MMHFGKTVRHAGRVRILPVAALAAFCLLASKGLDVLSSGEIDTVALLTPAANAQNAAGTGSAGLDGTAVDDAEAAEPAEGQAISLDDGLQGENTSERAVLERLAERRQMLERREESLDLRERLLEAAENQLEQRLAELSAIEQRIIAAVEEREQEETQRLQDLVTMYENMKPKEAARIFDTLDLDIMVSVVRQMNARKMGEILARMKPARAQVLTIELARPPQGSEPGLPDATALPKIGNDS